jgi:protein-disulfide isomerase
MKEKRLMRRTVGLTLLGCLLCLGCNGATSKDVEDLKKGQQDILGKLATLEQKVAQARPSPAAAPAMPDPNKVYNIPIANSPVRGPQNAKVTIVEFSDFQCPFCAQAKPLVDEVLKKYPNDVNFVYKQFPLTTIHPFALGASKAALAAGRQGKFWEMYDALFANNRELGQDKLKEYAKQIGLDVERWEKDMNSPEIQKEIDQDTRAAAAAEVRGTPTFFIGGKRVMNRSIDGMSQMIEEQLKASS